MSFPNADLLVDVVWLQEHAKDSNLRIVDARASDPRLPVGYRMGHIPNAIQLDLGRDLYTFERRMPELKAPEQIAQVLDERGIGDDHTVVIYDEGTGQLAGTIYWIFKFIGHRDARVLHGGWQAWRSANAPVTKDAPNFAPATYTVHLDESQSASADWIQKNQNRADLVLLDVRSDREFEMGHIPGAVNWSYDQALDVRTQTLKSADELRNAFATAGITPDKEVVVYCQTGARSSHSYLVLKALGYPHVRNYRGSMLDWFQVRRLPIE